MIGKKTEDQMERMTFAQALAADFTSEGIERNVRRLMRALRLLATFAAMALLIAAATAIFNGVVALETYPELAYVAATQLVRLLP
jgi:hypothetical protein